MKDRNLNPQRIVFIDKWVGTPLCALFSFFNRIKRRPLPSTADPEAIVFMGIAEIGALFLAYPAVEYTRSRFPDARILFITSPAGKEALELMGFNDDEIFLLRISIF